MIFRVLVVVGVATLALFSSQPALSVTGTQLYKQCSDKSEGIGNLGCMAFVRGFLDGFTLGIAAGKRGLSWCPPAKGIEADQARLIIEKHLRDHPQDLHAGAAFLSGDALMQAFPCQRR